MKLWKKLLFLLVALLTILDISNAQDLLNKNYFTKNVFYAECAGSLYFGNYNYSVNYERLLAKEFSVRAGIGAGRFVKGTTWGKSGIIMFNFLMGNTHKFELGLGVNYTYEKSTVIPDKNTDVISDVSYNKTSPCLSFSYRYQPSETGLFLRSGLTWVYNYGVPFQISIGVAF
jgi:hypothetical protein